MAIFVYAMGIIGFSGANVFYDSLLPSVADEDKIDYVSSLGFSMGYLGGGLLFLVNVLMTLMPQKFGLPDAAAAVPVSFLTVAGWWGLFTIFTIAWVKEAKTASPPAYPLFSSSLRAALIPCEWSTVVNISPPTKKKITIAKILILLVPVNCPTIPNSKGPTIPANLLLTL